jgi:FKBP-type peptidyl-prolyl cis-trans isomerase
MRQCLVFLLAAGLPVSSLFAQDMHAPAVAPTNSTQISYALGMQVVTMLQKDNFDVNMKAIAAGMNDTQAGHAALTAEEKKTALHEMQQDILAKAVAKKEAAGKVHQQEGQAFLAANAVKPGVKIKQIAAPDGSQAELQYRILKSGPPAASPDMADTVTVRYHGTLIDGTVFDVFPDSVKHGDVAILKMADVIPGWAAALQMMKPGDQWELYIPPSLGYADYGPPEIGMHTTLIYQLELVSFSKTQDPVSAGVSPAEAH